jgi:hypothetical protein
VSEDYLSPLYGPIKSRPFLTYDLESKDGTSQKPGFTRPFLAGWYDGVEYYHAKGKREDPDYWLPGGVIDVSMRRLLIPRNRGKIVYAHNAGRFDYLFLLPWLEEVARGLGFCYRVVPLQSSIQLLEVWTKGHRARWRFLDTVRLLQQPLDSAAKTFGFEGKMTFDLANDEDHPEWPLYNKVDVVQLYNVMTKYHYYVEERLKAEVKISTAGTAMSYYRRNHLTRNIPRESDTHDFVRQAYFGGRVEVYRKHGEGLRYYDINSSYPAAMLMPLPSGTCHSWEGPIPDKLEDDKTGFIEADVDLPPCDYPPLPVRHDGKLMFPCGRLSGVWSWVELKRVRQYVKRWGRSYWYESSPILATFVETLYKLRDKSSPDYDVGMAQIAKYLMNGLYGKFGMNRDRTRLIIAGQQDIPEGAWPADGTPDSPIWYASEKIDQPYIIPQIAATVTAYARVRLLDWMLKAQELGGSVYYTDTDALVTEVELPTSTALGDLKQEYGDNLIGDFVGPKMYALTEADGTPHVKAKGFGKEHRTIESIRKLVEGQAIAYDHLEKIGALARAGFQRGPRMVPKTKSLKTQIHKRVFDSDGSSKPIILKQW